MECISTPALMVWLGWQRVVITFAALTLAAQDDGSGQEEEGWGNQQEQTKASKDPHDLQGERPTKNIIKHFNLNAVVSIRQGLGTIAL